MKVAYAPMDAWNDVPIIVMISENAKDEEVLERIAKDAFGTFRSFTSYGAKDKRILHVEIPMDSPTNQGS